LQQKPYVPENLKYYVVMYENGKMRPVETIPEMEGGGIKEKDGGG
jgi:hypothetical protein